MLYKAVQVQSMRCMSAAGRHFLTPCTQLAGIATAHQTPTDCPPKKTYKCDRAVHTRGQIKCSAVTDCERKRPSSAAGLV